MRRPRAPAKLFDEAVGEQGDVTDPFPERRQFDVEYLQAVEQILAEVALLDRLSEIAVARGNHADLCFLHARAAETLKFALLKEAKQLGLCGAAHLAHLIQEQHAFGRELDLAGLGLMSAGKRSALVAEELRFEELLRKRRTVDGDEWAVPARRRLVDEPRDEFLPSSGFAPQKYRRIGWGDPQRVARARAAIALKPPNIRPYAGSR